MLLGLRVGNAPLPLRVGQLAIHETEFPVPATPSTFKITQETALTGRRRALRLAWQPGSEPPRAADHSAPRHYEIYRVAGEAGGADTLLGGTTNTVFFIDSLDRAAREKRTRLAVRAVGPHGERSEPAVCDIVWVKEPGE